MRGPWVVCREAAGSASRERRAEIPALELGCTIPVPPSGVTASPGSVQGAGAIPVPINTTAVGVAKFHWQPPAPFRASPSSEEGEPGWCQHPAPVTMTTGCTGQRAATLRKPLELKRNLNNYHPRLPVSPGTAVKDRGDAGSDVTRRRHRRNPAARGGPGVTERMTKSRAA
ncbi:unnamed protein product [Coccothraustes coccothraustes]